MNKIIRKATKNDSDTIAKVVLLAIGVDIERLSEHTSPFNYELVKALAEREDSQYSYKNCYVCEVNGNVAGAICSYDGARLYELRTALFQELEKRGTQLGKKITDECESGELYIDSLAVFKEYRGQGVAKALIAKVEEKSHELDIPILGLLVDKENPNAERLYSSLGFESVNTREFLGVPMTHMQKQI